MKKLISSSGINVEDRAISCAVTIIHKEAVERAKAGLMAERTADNLAEFFKVFSDITRVKILSSLKGGELCVCDMMAVLGLKQSTVSQQLRVLRQAHLVKSRQDGKQVYYSLDDDHIHKILSMGVEHLSEVKF